MVVEAEVATQLLVCAGFRAQKFAIWSESEAHT